MIKHQLKSFLNYWLYAVDHHSLHSPFLFDFYIHVILSKPDPIHFTGIEQVRQQYLQSDQTIRLLGLGSGSKHYTGDTREIRAIAKTSLTPQKYAALYLTIAQYFDSKTILELGTSLGINTAFLAQKKDAQIFTIEGEPEIAAIARSTFEQLKLMNIHLTEGDLDKTLPVLLGQQQTIDFAFLDANHQYEPTMHYFTAILKKIHTKSVIILDDIHQSEAMETAWTKIKSHELVYCSIDLYRCGIVFFDPSLNKQHVVLQY